VRFSRALLKQGLSLTSQNQRNVIGFTQLFKMNSESISNTPTSQLSVAGWSGATKARQAPTPQGSSQFGGPPPNPHSCAGNSSSPSRATLLARQEQSYGFTQITIPTKILGSMRVLYQVPLNMQPIFPRSHRKQKGLE
jgi:hypothetical protein